MCSKTKWRTGSIRRIAGTGIAGYSGDGNSAGMAQLNGPALEAGLCVHGLRMDSEGKLYFVDFCNHVLRCISFL